MEKVNIFSVFLFNLFRGLSKKYSSFFLMIVAILVYGFLFASPVSAETHISNDEITENTTWTKANSPYIIETSIYVHKDITLTIEPGVIVKFKENPNYYYSSGYSLDIDGKLIADGTKDDPIYFTSNYDDTVGGSTDGDYYSCDYEDYVLDENGDFLKDENGDYILDEEGDILGIGEKICNNYDYYDPYLGDWDGLSFENSAGSDLKNVFLQYSHEAFSIYSSSVNFENLNINNSDLGITGYNDSTAVINGGNFENIGDVFDFFNNSSLSVEGIALKNVETGFTGFTGTGYYDDHPEVIPYSNSYIDITDSTLDCTGDGITIFNEYSLTIKGGSISCAGDGVTLFNDVSANIDGVKIIGKIAEGETGPTNVGITAFNNTKPDTILVKNSEITGNEYGFQVWNSTFSAHKNSIHGNTNKGADTFTDSKLDFTSNFWGDKTGPKNQTSNPTGIGNIVSDNILFTPFLKYDPTKETKNPVIIIPGIMGTELIRDYGDKDEIWPAVSKVIFSIYDNYLRELELLPNGDENLDFPMKTRDIIREVPFTNVFKGLVSELESNGGYKEGENLFVFPYDWRFSNVKNAELLKEKIDKVLVDTEKEKVDIVAHSMGGLLTKEYIKENGKDKINHLIFLGTPHLGAPKAYKALIYGDSMGFGVSIENKELIKFLNDKVVKVISQNMPSIYELLPSRKYVSGLRYISEKTIGSDPMYLDYEATKNLLIEKETNQTMLESADTFHQGIDDIDLSGIKVSNFSACGEATLSAIDIKKEASIGPIKLKEDYKLKYANGDSTVPLDSSFGISNVDKYFVDKVTHSSLPSAPDVPDAVLSILENKSRKIDSSVFTDINNCTPIHGYILSIHSPISLDIYDTNGNYSGLDADGNIESNIEGVSYDTIGDAKFAFIPDGLSVEVKGSATGSGTFDLAIEKVVDGETTETKFWNDVPITSTSQMNFDFSSYSNTNSIEIDNNGNKKNVSNSNTLSQNEDYLAVPAKITEVKKQSGSGSYIKNNSKLITNILSPVTKPEILPDIKKFNIEKQPIIKKLLAKVKKKEVFSEKETIIPTSNLSASVINAGQDIDFWGTIRSFFRRLFHIKK